VIDYHLDSDTLLLSCRKVPWDTDVLQAPVGEIHSFLVRESVIVQEMFKPFIDWVHAEGMALISCRLPHDKLRESALLESNGFRFIEMVLHPVVQDINQLDVSGHGLDISVVNDEELHAVAEIAGSAFSYERFHVDPYLGQSISDIRYRRWVENSSSYSNQVLLKATEGKKLVGFFLVEYKVDTVYWHLTAVAPEFHGLGYGYRVWKAMIDHHHQFGARNIATTISARNTPVLNLYSKLGFRFAPPEMTFHWNR